MAVISFVIACKELKIAQIPQINEVFPFLNSICVYIWWCNDNDISRDLHIFPWLHEGPLYHLLLGHFWQPKYHLYPPKSNPSFMLWRVETGKASDCQVTKKLSHIKSSQEGNTSVLAWGAPYMLKLLVEPVRFIWCEIVVLFQHTWHRHWHGHPTRSPHRVGGWCCWIWGITSILMRVSPWGRTVRSKWLLRLCSFGVNRWMLSKHTAEDLKQCCKIRFRLQKKITTYPYPLLSTTDINPFAPGNFA